MDMVVRGVVIIMAVMVVVVVADQVLTNISIHLIHQLWIKTTRKIY